jgi:hypothetical protein
MRVDHVPWLDGAADAQFGADEYSPFVVHKRALVAFSQSTRRRTFF